MEEPVHLHNPEESKGKERLFLLLLPSLVFFFVLMLFVFKPKGSVVKSAPTPTFAPQKSLTVGHTDVQIKVADSDEKRSLGLGGVTSLKANEGMYFIFPQEDIKPAFWMKDMLIPIDIIWINDGHVAQISKSLPAPDPGTPDSALRLYLPDGPIDQVLEVPAGFADQNQISVGDQVNVLN